MAEWTNSRYAALVQAWRDAQEEEVPEGPGFTVRGFVLPDATDEPASYLPLKKSGSALG
ncbi:hypothetical protein BX264_5801 [Streptomyces sp. 2333.5]|uniref:hypothetical protein n=1 Tax=unclassified Streptomyces TaxID=2593676 RepID=UPI0008946172|nr:MULTISPECIES: hypothetical protein [unclassified Streptomyces]PJJ05343.1 hypothetical protein BX264_5801 [Streptomyces sp. 2333.5]SEE97804.1 hypothetical protein SAMN05428942_5899 [Streptomyces sp. 2112.2]